MLEFERDICPPNGYAHGQMVSIVMKFLKANPEKTHELAPLLILPALSQAFPCHSKDR